MSSNLLDEWNRERDGGIAWGLWRWPWKWLCRCGSGGSDWTEKKYSIPSHVNGVHGWRYTPRSLLYFLKLVCCLLSWPGDNAVEQKTLLVTSTLPCFSHCSGCWTHRASTMLVIHIVRWDYPCMCRLSRCSWKIIVDLNVNLKLKRGEKKAECETENIVLLLLLLVMAMKTLRFCLCVGACERLT